MDQQNNPVGRGAAANAYLQRMNERQNNNNIINNARCPRVDEDDLSNSDSDSNNNDVESSVRDNNDDDHPEEEEEEVLQPDAAVVQQVVYPPAAAASRRTTTKKRGKGKKIVSSAEAQPIRPAHVSMPPKFRTLKESDIKGASKQKSGQKTVVQVNQDRADEKLVELQIRMRAEDARAAFAADFGVMQGELPPVLKNKDGHNNRFATLDAVERTVRPVLARHGFSYSYTTEGENP